MIPTSEQLDEISRLQGGSLQEIAIAPLFLAQAVHRTTGVLEIRRINVENLSAARSRVLDADFAMETAELSRTQILQQAGVAILAQANAQPQLVLSLLK